MKILLATFLLVWFILPSFATITMEREFSEITVHDLVDYTTVRTVVFDKWGENDDYFYLSLREDEVLDNLNVALVKNGKLKKINVENRLSESNIDNSGFFSGVKVFYFPLSDPGHYEVSYRINSKETIFIAEFRQTGTYNSPSVLTHVYLAEGIVISDDQGTQKSGRVVIDTSTFNDSLNAIHTLVHPATMTPEEYFSKWFESRMATLSVFNGKQKFTKEFLAGKTDSTEIARTIFDYVQQKITYVDIENGINAIVPRDCNFVNLKGRGDCKDMANLLYAIYKEYGFEVYPAISRTRSRNKKLDFPSLSLANHMICVLYLDGKPVFLDATERYCVFGDPSLQVFNTEVFVIGRKPYFQSISGNTTSENKTAIHMVFHQLSEREWTTEMSVQVTGKMNTIVRDVLTGNQKGAPRLAQFIVDYDWQQADTEVGEEKSTLRFTAQVPKSDLVLVGSSFFVDVVEKIDLEKLCVIAYGDTIPAFKGRIDVQMQFPGAIKSTIKPSENEAFWVEQDKQVEGTLHYTLVSEEQTMSGKEWVALTEEFKKRFKNPIEIKNEKP